MARLITAAGTTVGIGPVLSSDTVTGISSFSGLTYVNIGLVETIGVYGDKASTVTFTSLSDSRVRKGNGAYDAGDITLTCGNLTSDAGQQAMTAAVSTNNTYAFRIQFNDKLDSTGTGSVDYFTALVQSKEKNVGDVNNIIRRNYSMAIDSQVYEVPATAGGSSSTPGSFDFSVPGNPLAI